MADLGSNWERESLGSRQYRQTIGLRPTAYLDKGIYRRISNDFVDGDQDYPHIVTAAPMMVSCGPDGKRRIHPTREPDRYIEIGAPYIKPAASWNKVNLGVASRVDNRLQWTTTNAIIGIDMGGHFAKLGILLRNGWQPPNGQFAFPVELAGLTRQGANLLADGAIVAKLRAPHVEDYDNPLDIRPIDWQFVNVSGTNYVLFTLPDLTGMSRPLVDPTIETIQPDETAGIDTMLFVSNPTFNYGINASIQVGRNGATGVLRGLLAFSLSTIPASALVSSAILSLFCYTEDSTTNYNVSAHRALTQWFEGAKTGSAPDAGQDGSTWNLRNANGAVTWAGGAGGAGGSDWVAVATATTAITAPNNSFAWNVTADVIAWLSGTSNYGWWLINASEATTNSNKYFASSANTTAANRPKLVITYTVGGSKYGLTTLVPGFSY